MGSDVANVTEYKTNEHKEEADQREGCGRTDHLWKKTRKISLFDTELFFFVLCILFSDSLKLLMDVVPPRAAA